MLNVPLISNALRRAVLTVAHTGSPSGAGKPREYRAVACTPQDVTTARRRGLAVIAPIPHVAVLMLAALLTWVAFAGSAGAATWKRIPVPPARPVSTCMVNAPKTAAQYAAEWASVDPRVWGAGDTALSVSIGTRSVWLYSDTAAGPDPQHWTRLVHSSAIIQTGGCLHVSNNGGQVLPNNPDKSFYWIDSAHAYGTSGLIVTGYELDATGKATGRFRDALVAVSATGDLAFRQWLYYRPAPPTPALQKDDGLMGNSVSYNGKVIISNILQPGPEYTYSPQLHPEAKLASGKTLLSLAVGWVSGKPGWQDMRPIYREVTP